MLSHLSDNKLVWYKDSEIQKSGCYEHSVLFRGVSLFVVDDCKNYSNHLQASLNIMLLLQADMCSAVFYF